ncbi:MAG TPA: sensor domain-containing diguanylate cyclase [Thermoanaerobaculia bacterium]|nr:sensor domain-containing diguanylate cyclase [Thermoanaerobaculia bacterium]
MTSSLPQETLLAVIAVQQEIAEADPALEQVMSVVAAAAARLTAADAAVVELHEGDEMVYRAGFGAAANHVGLRLKAAGSLSGLCVELDETLRCDDSETDDRVDREACRRVGARSMLVTPLHYRRTALGALKVYSSRGCAFDDAAADVLRLLVGIISASMHRAREHEGMTRRALHDVLTGLANRAHLASAIDAKIARRKPFALVFLDVNDFKEINDRRGHAGGDAVLQAIARRVASSVRDGDVAARFGGDEFVVLLEGVGSRAEAVGTSQRLVERISGPIDGGDGPIHVTVSAGVALFPEDAASAESLLHIADSRMYSDKQGKR